MNHASTFLADLAYHFFICYKTFNIAFRKCSFPQPHVSTHTSVFLIQNGNALQHIWAPKSSWPFCQQLNSQCSNCKTMTLACMKHITETSVKFKCSNCNYQFEVLRMDGVTVTFYFHHPYHLISWSYPFSSSRPFHGLLLITPICFTLFITCRSLSSTPVSPLFHLCFTFVSLWFHFHLWCPITFYA